jgi:hypothetical protein
VSSVTRGFASCGQVEELGKYPHLLVPLTDGEELRHPGIEEHKRIAPLGVDRHLLAGRRIHVAILKLSVRVQNRGPPISYTAGP